MINNITHLQYSEFAQQKFDFIIAIFRKIVIP